MQEFEPQISFGLSPNLDTMLYYSAPSSPIRRIGSATFGYEFDENNSNSEFFEFVTFQDFGSESQKFDDIYDQSKDEMIKSANSLSQIAFADELFCNGQVKPLKLPPRLQNGNATTSPLSPIKSKFARRNMCNDDFDPFKIALEKVSERRKSVHRRARSHSPFRATRPIESDDDSIKQSEKVGPIENGLAKPKGLAYSRWARLESMGHKSSSPKRPMRFKGLSFMKKVRPGHEETTKPTLKESGETKKMEKVKGIIKRYASIGKQNKLENQVSTNYFKNLSLKFKGNGGNKKVVGESRMVVIPYRPNKFTLCLGYGSQSPRS